MQFVKPVSLFFGEQESARLVEILSTQLVEQQQDMIIPQTLVIIESTFIALSPSRTQSSAQLSCICRAYIRHMRHHFAVA